MKKMFFMLFAICVAVVACNKNEPKYESLLVHKKTILGGCNGDNYVLANDLVTRYADDASDDYSMEPPNIVTVTVSENVVNVFVGLNYICAAPFETKVETENGVIVMSIIDTCRIGYEYCYARCYCYYIFDFVFERESETELNQKYKIVLIDPRENEPIIISEGVITAD